MKSEDSNSEKSVSYQKKDGRGHVHPSFFWYDNDKDLEVCFLVTCVRCAEATIQARKWLSNIIDHVDVTDIFSDKSGIWCYTWMVQNER